MSDQNQNQNTSAASADLADTNAPATAPAPADGPPEPPGDAIWGPWTEAQGSASAAAASTQPSGVVQPGGVAPAADGTVPNQPGGALAVQTGRAARSNLAELGPLLTPPTGTPVLLNDKLKIKEYDGVQFNFNF